MTSKGTTSRNAQCVSTAPHIHQKARRKVPRETWQNPTWAKKEIPRHVVHMIIGGTDIPQVTMIKRTKLSAVIEGSIRDRVAEDTLAFSEEDLETLAEPYNDALVISFLLNNIQVKRILVDLGSSANVIRSEVVEQLGLLDQIIPTSQVIHDFNMDGEVTKVEITLLVDTSDMVLNTKFQVINGDMGYNALLGRSWIHNIKAVSSTLH
uniref:Uncharacterized protein LOC104227421 n=1 Tax=Nicotiana sylvestris TaxID=4096 RepID=A0A1U7WDB1_NICSY|nr:PREDICTED: uncharacterized protein LOC104227421 [Nicotiana sylvestris]